MFCCRHLRHTRCISDFPHRHTGQSFRLRRNKCCLDLSSVPWLLQLQRIRLQPAPAPELQEALFLLSSLPVTVFCRKICSYLFCRQFYCLRSFPKQYLYHKKQRFFPCFFFLISSQVFVVCVRYCSYLTKLHRLSSYKNIVYSIIFTGRFKGFSCKLPKTTGKTPLKCKEFHSLYERDRDI